MKYIEDLKVGDAVTETYLCKEKRSGTTKNGADYFLVTLQDKTGVLEGNIWDVNSPGINEFDKKDYVEVSGVIKEYKGKNQINITSLRVVDVNSVNVENYIPTTDKDVDEMYGELLDIIGKSCYGIVIVASEIAVLGGEVERRILFNSRNGSLGHATYVCEVLLHPVLLDIDVFDRHQGIAGLVGSGIAGKELVECLQCLVVLLCIIVNQAYIQHSLRNKTALRILLDEVVVIEKCHLVVVADQIGIGNLEHCLWRQRRVAEFLEDVVQTVEFFDILALGAIAQCLLIGGVVGILTLSVYHPVVIAYGSVEIFTHIQAVALAVIGVKNLLAVGLCIRKSQEFSKFLLCTFVVFAAHIHVASRVERLGVVCRALARGGGKKTVKQLLRLAIVGQTVLRLCR